MPLPKSLLIGLSTMTACSAASAEPMRIDDTTPRRVLVEFEASPTDRPGELDTVYNGPFPARLEPDAHGNTVVRIPGAVLEQGVFRTRHPIPGSFSDYVWVFDGKSGEVLSASFSGRLLHELDFGLAKAEIEARVAARMSTVAPAGFTPPRHLWGRTLNGFCEDARSARCTLVEPARYDRRRGYVNAVGSLQIDSSFIDLTTFSALGEARFSEARPGQDPIEPAPRSVAVSDARGAESGPPGIDVSAPPPAN